MYKLYTINRPTQHRPSRPRTRASTSSITCGSPFCTMISTVCVCARVRACVYIWVVMSGVGFEVHIVYCLGCMI